jgi:hypothetical protein
LNALFTRKKTYIFSDAYILSMKKPTPQEIYQAALKERDQPDPLKKRQACEKGWLAVTEAVDQYLAAHGIVIKKGTAEAHVQRMTNLANLVGIEPEAKQLTEKVPQIAELLHGACFYGGEESPHFDTVLKKTVRQILELTGYGDNGQEE